MPDQTAVLAKSNGKHVNDTPHPSWRFLTSHALVLLAVHKDPEIRMRDLASGIGITERRAQEIVSELVEAGFLSRERIGRRNHYGVRADLRVKHPDWGEHNLGDVLSLAAMWTGLGREGRPGESGGNGWRSAEEDSRAGAEEDSRAEEDR
jgi:hypothetical protein